MFWVVVLIVLSVLLIPAVVAYSNLPQENKPSKKVIIFGLAISAILPGINVLVLYSLVIYGLVKLVNAYLQAEKEKHS